MKPIERKLRRLIREELIRALITERFGSKILTKLHTATTKPAGKNMYLHNNHNNKAAFQMLSKSYNIQWDKITDKDIKKSNRLSKNGLEIIVAQAEGSVSPTSGWRSSGYFQKGQILGISMNGKRVWVGGGYYDKRAATGQGSREGNLGLDVRGFNKLDQLMKLGEIKPIVLQIDHKAGGDASEVRASREEARKGALALKKAKEVSKENNNRYADLIRKAKGAQGIEPLKKMFDEVAAELTTAVTEATDKIKDGFISTAYSGALEIASNYHSRMMRILTNFIEYDLDVQKQGDDSWNKNSRDSAAKEMHNEYKSFKKQMKELNVLIKAKGAWKKIESRY